MATALQRQLAQISANSTHQLDLKAQKTQHAKSLLFEPQDASRQSFDDIFHICIEGFEELCQLDARFTSFSNNLFSDSCKEVDRGQLTRSENEEIDGVLGTFLGLVQGRLLLTPAQKSVEWLVRRWRVHEFNTESLLLTFLPYHSNERMFPALLAILPTDRPLPESFKWLHPYIASLSCPPRHALLSAAVSNRNFFTSFNSYVLRAAKAGHASTLTLSFWAGLVAQAVNVMIDSSRSGRDEIRRQREEEILLRVLPILQEAFIASRKAKLDEMFLGACMISTVLATKASLSDAALDAIMEAISGACTNRTMSEAISCLAILAEEKTEASIPARVVRILSNDAAVAMMLRQVESQRVSKLAAGLSISVLRAAPMNTDDGKIHMVQAILETNALDDQDTLEVLKTLTSLRESSEGNSTSDALSVVISRVENSERYSGLLQQHRHELGLSAQIDTEPEPISADEMKLDTPSQPHHKQLVADLDDINKLLATLPQLPSELYSFLEPNHASFDAFQAYERMFQSAIDSNSSSFFKAFLDVPSLQRAAFVSQPTFLSFLARLWSSENSIHLPRVRARALEVARDQIATLLPEHVRGNTKDSLPDFQALLPYLFTALSDEKRKIRATAAELCTLIHRIHNLGNAKKDTSDGAVWSRQSIYGSDAQSHTKGVPWLSTADAKEILSKVVMPVLEDFLLDSGYLVRRMMEVHGRSSATGAKNDKTSKPLSKDARAAICSFLASHVRATPVLRTKMVLLQILSQVGKEANAARDERLVPFVEEWTALSAEQIQVWCKNEGVESLEMDVEVTRNLTHGSSAQSQCLKDICTNAKRSQLIEVAFDRQRQLWPAMKTMSAKMELVEWLQDLALGQASVIELVADCARETLRALDLPLEVAVHMIETLPSTSDLETQPPTAKRQRRTSENERQRVVDDSRVNMAIRKITLVLELLEAAKLDSPTLLKPMFHLLAELRHYKTITESDLVYLHTLLLDSILAIVTALRTDKSAVNKLQRDAIRTDLLIDCVRSTSSTQIHNTALLIVSALASLAPESVLHSIVPLFTFMSSTVLRRGDEYSAHVTDQAVSRIIPALVESLKSQSRGLLGGVSELLLSFVAAWEHVPLHRRLDLFDMIIRAIGDDDCLGVVLAMLVERYATSKSSVNSFIGDLVNRFWARDALKAANQWMELVPNALNPPNKPKHKTESLSDSLLSFSDKDEDEQEDALINMLEGLQAMLENETVQGRLSVAVLASGATEAGRVQAEYAKLTEKVIELTQMATTTRPATQPAANSLFSAVLSLLPTESFVASCAQLMQSGSSSVRRQIFQSLESRVYQAKPRDARERQIFLDVLPSCAVFIQQDQPVEVRIAAIGCIDAICNKFGKSDVQSVKNAAKQVAGPAALGADDTELKTFSLLCLASVAGVLGDGDESVELFPKVVAQTLDYLAAITVEAPGSTVDVKPLKDAGFSLLTAALDHVPWILASASTHLDRALDTAAGLADANDVTVDEFIALATKKVPAQDLFSSIQRIWPLDDDVRPADLHRWTKSDYNKVTTLVRLLELAVQHHTKATITKIASTLFGCLLKAFDIRRQLHHPSKDVDLSEDDELFQSVDQLALDTTLKLNDATFRPFFMRLVDWATSTTTGHDGKDRAERLKSVYSFALLLFERLKSLVTSYVSFLLDSIGEVLRTNSKLSVDGALLHLVLETLGSSFRSDEDDFWMAPAHFDFVSTPLVKLLGVEQAPQNNKVEATISTITDLTAAVASSPEQLKAMNANLLSLLRHEKAPVRLAAVQCQRSVTKRVTFDWCALLPELLPAISELQEDDDERVERDTLLWVQEIEDISGESLAGMLA